MSDRALAFGLLLSGSQPLPKTIQVVTRADELGFEALWYADEKFYRDPYVGLTVAATHTRRVRIGTGVTDPYSRHPALTAMAAATLDEIAEGRVMVGLGAGGSGFPPMGISRTKPIFAVREAVDLMRRLWRGEVVNAHGEVISFVNGRL